MGGLASDLRPPTSDVVSLKKLGTHPTPRMRATSIMKNRAKPTPEFRTKTNGLYFMCEFKWKVFVFDYFNQEIRDANLRACSPHALQQKNGYVQRSGGVLLL